MQGRGKASSTFETDTISRDDLRYYGKALTDPINTAEVLFISSQTLQGQMEALACILTNQGSSEAAYRLV